MGLLLNVCLTRFRYSHDKAGKVVPMNIQRTASSNSAKAPESKLAQNPKSPGEQALGQHMQDVLLQGRMDDFFVKVVFEDDFLASQPKPSATIADKISSLVTRKATDYAYPGHNEWVQREFQDYKPGSPEADFKPISAERFIDELDHQAERYAITGNERRAKPFQEASEALAGRTGMTLHDALKNITGNEESVEKIKTAYALNSGLIHTEGVAVSELRQNVEILELRVQEQAKADRKAAGGQAPPVSAEHGTLRQELQQAREALSHARKDPQQAEALYADLSGRRAAEGITLTAGERAEKNPFTGTIEETRTKFYESPVADAAKYAGWNVAFGAAAVGLAGMVGGMAAVPGMGLLMNGVFLKDDKAWVPATVGVAGNLMGTVGLATGDPALAVVGLGLSGVCSIASGLLYQSSR